MPPQSRRRQGDFLKPYRIDSRYLLRPDHKRGRPGILSGENESGDPVIIKEWRRDSAGNDAELREIWHHEIRQLHRLGGYPKASDFIATLQHTGWDDIGFYLVLDPGQRRPLATIIEHGIKSNWLSNPRLPANRSLLWKNLKRVCAGLETLHSQGLLHKNLDNWSILTSSGEEPDFQLTGFEWSIRLVGAATKQSKQKSPNNPTGEPASFLSDWRDFGVLAAELLNVQISHIKDPKIPPSGIADHLLTEESRLLRNLLQIDVLDRLDGEVVEQRISNIIRLLEAEIAARDAKFYLVVRLGTNSDLSKEIRTASGDEIEIDSYREQTEFIMDDLRQNSLLIGVKTETGDGFRLILEGSKLIYQINPYNHSNSSSSNTWEVAYTEECERKFPASVNIISQVELPTNSLEVMTNRDAKKRYGRLRGKLSSWESLRREFISQQPNRDRDAKLHQALALTQFLEALFAVADSFPVEIVSQENREDGSLLMVKARSDADRDSLSVAIGMKPPALRLDDALVKDKRGGDWVLTEAKYLGDRAPTDTLWKFEAKPSAPSGPEHYQFIGTNTPGHLEDPVLIPGDFSGRDIQFQRRLKALRALADHSELLWMLVDPRRRILDTHVPVEANDAFSDLDDSKQQAVKEIIETLPLYLVQGPPGVGKTRMVRELVKDTFENDQTARLLLSAQSNAAVDHLMETVRESFQDNTNDILIVRCRSRDNTREPGPYEIENQLKGVVSRFSESDLVKNSDPALHENVRNLASEIMGEGKSNLIRHSSNRNAKQAIEGLVVRSANIVFATTNSYELERLIDERNQFDWSIIEEAGKATGGELLSPLLLSHRRLMIGDHKQLSPFGSERIIKLLDNPETVLNALKVGQGYISRNLRDPSTDEILDEINDEKSHEIGSICALSLDCLLLFERLIENEFLHQKKKSKTRKIAHQLN
ncbi:MAG: AAA domain-containing protein [Rhodospirillaceae bacterium]